MKKRLLAAVLFAAMVICLAACGNSGTPKGTVEEAETAAAEAAETVAAEETAAGETEAETVEFELGKTTGLVYENEYFGIGCNLPEGWVSYTEEQIADLNGIVMDSVDESVKEQLEQSDYLYDMVVSAPDGGNNMNIILQKLNLLQANADLDMEQALKASEDQLKTALESMGASDVELNFDRGLVFPAEGYACGVVTCEMSGTPLTERLVLFQKGGYLVNITVAAFGDDITEEILDGFYALD